MKPVYSVMRLDGSRAALLAEASSIKDAVVERESHVRHGGDVRIFQEIPTLQAYAMAAAETATPLFVYGEVNPALLPRPMVYAVAPAGSGGDLEYTPEELELIGKAPAVVPDFTASRPATKVYEASEVTE